MELIDNKIVEIKQNIYFSIKISIRVKKHENVIKEILFVFLSNPYIPFEDAKSYINENIILNFDYNLVQYKRDQLINLNKKLDFANFDTFLLKKIVEKIVKWQHTYGEFQQNELEFLISKIPGLINFILSNNISPTNYFNMLSERVKGQETALKTFSGILYQWIKFWEWKDNNIKAIKPSSTSIFIGSSGSGKTYTVKTAAELFKLGFIQIDASRLVAEGYVGTHLSTEIIQQFKNLKEDYKNRVIVFIDEFDKLSSHYSTESIKGQGVLFEMLKLFEENEISGYNSYSKDSEMVKLNIENFCFLLGGAFEGYNKANIKPIGFNLKNPEILNKENESLPSVLLNYGLPKEIVGRINNIIVLDELKETHLKQILNSDFGPLKYFELFFENHKIPVKLSETETINIIEKALSYNIGARGLSIALNEFFNKKIINF